MAKLNVSNSTPKTKKSSRDQSTSSVQNIAKAGIPSSRRGDKRRRREEFIIDIGLTKWYKYRTTLGDKKTPLMRGLFSVHESL